MFKRAFFVWYCAAGHRVCSSEEITSQQCRECGAPRHRQCRHCGSPMPTFVVSAFDDSTGKPVNMPPVPSYCDRCGLAVPWNSYRRIVRRIATTVFRPIGSKRSR
ncbi:MAG: DUF2321 domain-containing protein [Planctomycetota bacterium]|nr:MAG: DUF2321 domain-containing protein [Planctomycetota bacterium]